MTVTVVCDVLGRENNGTTIAAMNLIRTLKSRGHEVRVVCADSERRREEGYYVVPTYNLLFLNGYVAKNGVSLARPVKSIIREALTGADEVHIMIPFGLGCAAAKLAKQMGIPISAGFHCQAENFTNHIFLMNSKLANNITYKVFYKKLYRYCDAVHYPTQFICDVFETAAGPTNHYVISNGVNRIFKKGEAQKPDRFKDKFVILFTGRYSREKSHKVLLKAVSLSAHRDEIGLIFAGDGPQRKNIIEYADELGIERPMMNFFTRSELVNIINCADLYVHPAEIEIEAIACLEALSCGKVPVISDSNRSATRYFAIDDKDLFRCNDSADLALKIDYWIEHPKERAERGREYEGYTDRFDFDNCMNAMEKMIIETAEKKK